MTIPASLPPLSQGDATGCRELAIDRLDVLKYASAAQDWVRVHWDHPGMLEQGYPDIIVHGWLLGAHMCRMVLEWTGPHYARVSSYALRYHQPAFPGTLKFEAHVASTQPKALLIEATLHNAEGRLLTTLEATVSQE